MLILIAMAFLIPATAHASTRACGLTPRIDGARYDVKEIRGAVPCAKVKQAVTKFLRGGEAPSPWICTRGHGSSQFAASCAQGEKVLVRVYAPN